MNNILVTGCKGQLGSEIKELANNYENFNFLFTDINQLDITNNDKVAQIIENNNINCIINCAAYTSVDKAEKFTELADQINNKAVENFAKIAKKNKIKFIHISTDYVFDGDKVMPYSEIDFPNPQSVYGKTKLDGERALIRINPLNSIIIRTSWVYSKFGNNFIKTMMNLSRTKSEISVVSDQIGSPTNAYDLAKVILDILENLENNKVQIYHFSNSGKCSWYDFAKALFEIKNIQIKIRPIKTSDYQTAAKRPKYSVLDNELIKKTFNIEILNWRDSLELMAMKI